MQARKIPEYKHHNILPAAVMDAIKPTYICLNERSLLKRCLRGATRNQNEDFNGLIWSLCPMVTFCGAAVVEIASYLPAAHVNHGAVCLLKVLADMGSARGLFTERLLVKLDEERVSAAQEKMKEAEKSRRKQQRKDLEEQNIQEEGGWSPMESSNVFVGVVRPKVLASK